MPGVEVPHLPRTHLKSHKALPRKKNVIPRTGVIHIFNPSPDETASDGHVVMATVLPLTPPSAAVHNKPYPSQNPAVGVMTPSQHIHPPTPETTPPRTTST